MDLYSYIAMPSTHQSRVVSLGLLLTCSVFLSSCKESNLGSQEHSIEAMRTGDVLQRDNHVCGINPSKKNVASQSPEEAVKAVYAMIPDFYLNIFGNDPDKVVVLTEQIDCVCGVGAQACWGEAGREMNCKKEDKAQSLALFSELKDQSQPVTIKIYLPKNSVTIHNSLIATMGYALLDNRFPNTKSCKHRDGELRKNLTKAKAATARDDAYIDVLETDLERLKNACESSKSVRKGALRQFAESALLPDDKKNLTVATEFFRPLLDRYGVSTLKKATEIEAIQDLMFAESIESYFCSPQSNKDLLDNLPGAFAQVQQTFGNPRSFKPANAGD